MLPVFFENIFQQFYHLADTLIVGRIIGIDALAAVGVTGPLIFFALTFIFAATQGFSIVTAKMYGAENFTMVKKSFTSSVILSGLLTVIITLITVPFTKHMLMLLNTPENILNDANTYLFIMFAGIITTIYYNLSSNIVRALGDSKTPLIFLIVSTILNLFMDILFVVKFRWGIEGVAWATIAAQSISTILCVSYMLCKFPIMRVKTSDRKVSWDFIYEHLKVGIPIGIQMSVLSFGVIALQYVLNSFGSVAIAAFTASLKVEQTFAQLFLALGITVAVYTAQNFGAKKLSRINAGVKASLIISLVFYFFSIICIGIFSTNMVSMFVIKNNIEMFAYADKYLHIMMFFFIFFGMLMIFKNVLQGMGRVTAPLASGFTELVARIFCAFVLGYYFGFTGLCVATPIAWLAASAVLYAGYVVSMKKQVKLLKSR